MTSDFLSRRLKKKGRSQTTLMSVVFVVDNILSKKVFDKKLLLKVAKCHASRVMRFSSQSWVDFTNILQAAFFSDRYQKRKRHQCLDCLFCILVIFVKKTAPNCEQLLHRYSFAQKLQSQTVIRENLCKALLY